MWMVTTDIRSLIIQHEFYKELLARTTDERNIEEDVALRCEKADEEKVYELIRLLFSNTPGLTHKRRNRAGCPYNHNSFITASGRGRPFSNNKIESNLQLSINAVTLQLQVQLAFGVVTSEV